MSVISVINYKGGVGKTTSVFNIGISLRKIYDYTVGSTNGKVKSSLDDFSETYNLDKTEFIETIKDKLPKGKILLIDLDPQSSLSKLCLKRVNKKSVNLKDLTNIETINFVFKSYIQAKDMGVQPNFDLKKLIKSNDYNIDFIPSTMFYNDTVDGLDNIEIELARNNTNALYNLTILSKFVEQNNLTEKYDFIIFDCPPANNIITQNALLMSDHYLIPTIMDDMSANGIPHLDTLIQNSIIKFVTKNYNDFIQMNCQGNYLKYLSVPTTMLGIFETIRDVRTKYNQNEIRQDLINGGYTVYDEIIGDYNDIPKENSNGKGCIDIDFSGKKIDCAKSYLMISYHILNDIR